MYFVLEKPEFFFPDAGHHLVQDAVAAEVVKIVDFFDGAGRHVRFGNPAEPVARKAAFGQFGSGNGCVGCGPTEGSGGFSVRNRPDPEETENMVDPVGVVILGALRQPLLPPAVAVGAEIVPVVYRKAPVLSRRIRAVRRISRPEVVAEKLGVGPGIARILVHHYRDVALERDAEFCAVCDGRGELLVEAHLHPGEKEVLRTVRRFFPAVPDLGMGRCPHPVPGLPGCVEIASFEVHEYRIFGDPGIIIHPLGECGVSGDLCFVHVENTVQQFHLGVPDFPVVVAGQAFEAGFDGFDVRLEGFRFGNILQSQVYRMKGKSRKGAVGGTFGAGIIDRQQLDHIYGSFLAKFREGDQVEKFADAAAFAGLQGTDRNGDAGHRMGK